ncbi:MAG: hypothetical protein JRD89_07115 [Deltaproteobacteria bacterium]|nr:hypothetical protein [Deltaproteobacteria bacterium]
MRQPEEPSLEQQVEAIRGEVAALADKLKIGWREALLLLMHREIVIANRQLTRLLTYEEARAERERAYGGR